MATSASTPCEACWTLPATIWSKSALPPLLASPHRHGRRYLAAALIPDVTRKKITAAFVADASPRMAASCFWPRPSEGLQLADRLATAIQDSRNPQRVTHARPKFCAPASLRPGGYEMPTISIGCAPTRPSSSPVDGCPTEGIDLCSQPTCSRLENRQNMRTVIRLGWVLVHLWLSSYAAPSKSATLDIADTLDVVHSHQQLSPFNAPLRRALLPADRHL
ncbi:hypothetical protein DPM33_35275 [Mesorhizobium hawassense]|uniref:Transposase DDE domain-containing protein n=1 Tax=Mesorhizobium hawassense TaxID=1209954 RepID=A0A330H1D4_9HYPH|nr:hypothetical protein DPM33_35275 [Mesorhizobium hawassense]